MKKDFDAIIIGSGLGGLTAGAKLAREGRNVLVLEKHAIPGGYATSFRRKDFIFEIGLQELDGLDKNDIKTEIFKDLGIFNRVDFVSLPNESLVSYDQKTLILKERKEEELEDLIRHYPSEEKGIKKVFSTLTAIRQELRQLPLTRKKIFRKVLLFPFIYPSITRYIFTTTGRFLDRHIKSSELKQLLLTNLMYFHNDPEELSILYFSAGQGSYWKGSHYIKGGSNKLARALADIIRENGGTVLTGATAEAIEVQNGKVRSIEYNYKRQRQKAFTQTLVSNASPFICSELLPSRYGKPLKQRIDKMKISPSFVQVSICFSRPLKECGINHYKTLICGRAPLSINNKMDFYSSENFTFTDYGQIDSDLAPEGKSYGLILLPDTIRNWQDLGKEEYKRQKENVYICLRERLEKTYPGITQWIEYYEVSTPQTMKRYTGNPEGAVYGFAQTSRQAGIFRFPIKTAVKGLYFASAWTYPGGGFTGSLWSGWSCAAEIMDSR